MIWLIPFLLVCLFLLFRFVSPYEPLGIPWRWGESPGGRSEDGRRKRGTQVGGSEAFAAPPLVSDAFRTAYQGFLGFYQPFMERWRDALVRTYALEQSPEKGKKDPTEGDLTQIITQLTSSLGKPFPSLSGEGAGGAGGAGGSGGLPAPASLQTLEDMDRGQLLRRIPEQAQPYQNAIEWMNEKLLRAEKELEEALKGGGLPAIEGYEGQGQGKCAELSQCFRDNPELVRQLLNAQQEEAGQRLERTQKEIMTRFEQFQQPRLVSAFELNGRLVRKAKETEAKAQSGDWIKDVRIGSGEKGPVMTAPAGGDALEELRRKDPERYAALEKKNASLFSLKQLMEQINRGLRS